MAAARAVCRDDSARAQPILFPFLPHTPEISHSRVCLLICVRVKHTGRVKIIRDKSSARNIFCGVCFGYLVNAAGDSPSADPRGPRLLQCARQVPILHADSVSQRDETLTLVRRPPLAIGENGAADQKPPKSVVKQFCCHLMSSLENCLPAALLSIELFLWQAENFSSS